MKLFIAAAVLVLSSNSFAYDLLVGPSQPTIMSAVQSGNLMPPRTSDAVLTTLQVSYSACATFGADDFDVNFEETREGVNVDVSVKYGTTDCMAIGQARTVEIRTNKIPATQKINVVQEGVVVQLEVERNFVY